MKRFALYSLMALGLACGSDGGEAPIRIVLITLDTLRYDSFAGSPDHASDMPATRRLAEGARVFRRHYSATSTTQPTHASLLTGLHPWQHGVHRNGVVLEDSLETVVERMKLQGFSTGAVVASFPVHSRFGFAQGFDRFIDVFSQGQRQHWNQIDVPGGNFYSLADEITEKALQMLDTLSGSKQFFWFHYFDAHHPYGDSPGGDSLGLIELKAALREQVPDALDRVALARGYYDRDVRHMDASLDRLFARLLRDAESIETHILVVSDHGESFGERGAVGHGEDLTPEQIHVPLFIHSPRATPGTSDLPVGSVDVAATLDALAGGNLPGPGRNLIGIDAAADDRSIVGMRRTFARPIEDVRTDGEIRIVEGLRFYAVVDDRLYTSRAEEIAADDGKAVDPDLEDQLSLLFRSFEADLEGRDPAEILDPETQQALEALGYLR